MQRKAECRGLVLMLAVFCLSTNSPAHLTSVKNIHERKTVFTSTLSLLTQTQHMQSRTNCTRCWPSTQHEWLCHACVNRQTHQSNHLISHVWSALFWPQKSTSQRISWRIRRRVCSMRWEIRLFNISVPEQRPTTGMWTWLWWTSWWCVFERCVCPPQSTTGELFFFKKQKGLVPRKSSSSLTSTVVLQVHAKHLWQCPAWQHDQFPWQHGQKGSPLTWPFGWQTKISQQESQFLRMEPN